MWFNLTNIQYVKEVMCVLYYLLKLVINLLRTHFPNPFLTSAMYKILSIVVATWNRCSVKLNSLIDCLKICLIFFYYSSKDFRQIGLTRFWSPSLVVTSAWALSKSELVKNRHNSSNIAVYYNFCKFVQHHQNIVTSFKMKSVTEGYSGLALPSSSYRIGARNPE